MSTSQNTTAELDAREMEAFKRNSAMRERHGHLPSYAYFRPDDIDLSNPIKCADWWRNWVGNQVYRQCTIEHNRVCASFPTYYEDEDEEPPSPPSPTPIRSN